MRPRRIAGAAALAGLALAAAGAVRDAPPSLAAPFLDAFEPEGEGVAQHRLPRALGEVSGLAVDERGRLFAHDDERARVWRLDPLTGEALASFTLGAASGVAGDFEGIAVMGERFFLVTSQGTIVEFREGADGAVMPFQATATPLADACEVEGLAADAARGRLLLACKAAPGGRRADGVRVWELPADTLGAAPRVRLSLPFDALAPLGLEVLHPSGVELLPGGRGLLLVAAEERVLVEFGADGTPLAVLELRRSRHRQPEGLALDASGALLVADEGAGGRARLTRMPPRTGQAAPPGGP